MEELYVLKEVDMSIEDFAFQLTAYEKWGMIDYENGVIDLVVNEFIDIWAEDQVIDLYREYCIENRYEVWEYNNEEFFEMNFDSPMEAVRAACYGNYQYHHSYVRIDGANNLESCDADDIICEVKDDSYFKEWLLNNCSEFEELLDEDNKEVIIKKALELVKQGY